MTDTNSPSSDVAALLAEADDHGLGHRLVHSLAAALRDSERIRQAETKNANYLSVRLAASEAERERLQRELDVADVLAHEEIARLQTALAKSRERPGKFEALAEEAMQAFAAKGSRAVQFDRRSSVLGKLAALASPSAKEGA